MLTACMIFGLTEQEFHALPKDEQKRRRTVAKRVNFGIAYGIGAPGIQHTLKSDRVLVSEEEARSYLSAFYDKYPRVTSWIEKIEKTTADDAFSRSLFGRRRRLLEIMSSDNELISRAKRQAVNHVIQSTAGDLTMTALCLYDQEVCLRAGRNPALIHPTVGHMPYERDDRWKRVHPILQVHDMIGVDCHKDVAVEATDRLIDIMQNVAEYAPLVWGDCVIKKLAPIKKVPILAEAEVGPNWRDAVKVKTGKDIPCAMSIARKKQQMLDADPRYEWGEKDEKSARAAFEKAA
jgi:DNA polymerase I-like protein with 3'-5' exonuclease and polymerase domains